MMNVIRYEKLGRNRYDWLDARHHFSFGGYRDARRMGFGALRVINDDIIAPQSGFDMHPHRDMEIITFLRSGAITHRDSLGNEGTITAGSVQVMSAGAGIVHAEWNRQDEETRLFQIWIMPNAHGVTPRWEEKRFVSAPANDLPLLVSGRPEDEGKGALFIHQDAAIYGGALKSGAKAEVPVKHQAYVLISKGEAVVQGERLKQGDGAEVTEVDRLHIEAPEGAEVLVVDVPA